MKVFYKFFILLFLIYSCKKSDNYSSDQKDKFVKFYGGSLNNYSYDCKQTSDGGYIFFGTSNTLAKKNEMYLGKADKYGNLQWERFFGDSLDDLGKSFQIASDGSLVLSGTSTNSDKTTSVYLVKTDADGNEKWSIKVPTTKKDETNSLCIAKDGSIVITGSTISLQTTPIPTKDLLIIKFDNSGVVTKRQVYSGTGNDIGESIIEKNNGGFIIVGSTESFAEAGQLKNNIWVVEVNQNMIMTNMFTYGGKEDDFGDNIVNTKDGGYIITGSTSSMGNGLSDIYLLKTGSDIRDIKFEKTYGGAKNEESESLIVNSDSLIVIAGTTESFGNGAKDAIVIIADSNGKQIKQKTFGGSGNESFYSISQTTDGGYIFSGNTDLNDKSMITLIKVTQNIDGIK